MHGSRIVWKARAEPLKKNFGKIGECYCALAPSAPHMAVSLWLTDHGIILIPRLRLETEAEPPVFYRTLSGKP